MHFYKTSPVSEELLEHDPPLHSVRHALVEGVQHGVGILSADGSALLPAAALELQAAFYLGPHLAQPVVLRGGPGAVLIVLSLAARRVPAPLPLHCDFVLQGLLHPCLPPLPDLSRFQLVGDDLFHGLVHVDSLLRGRPAIVPVELVDLGLQRVARPAAIPVTPVRSHPRLVQLEGQAVRDQVIYDPLQRDALLGPHQLRGHWPQASGHQGVTEVGYDLQNRARP
mmetsp:Transcript_9645/g.33254  ORF Transcript_9645/g.33254 Transcript_9645/m.33254 type:complete len:225 (+) Transcript_9645:1103-1777(+)